jgi:hypothetical protein
MLSQTIHPTFGQTTNSCVDTSVKSISASGSTQNFPPNNVIDNNFNTVWSYYGKGSWIQFDLGSSKNICSVNIAWYKGDARENNFVIATSSDGTTYKNILSSKSSGNTLSFDKYVIPTTSARYVKIIVNGNTQNDYASITEVKLQTTTLNQPQQTQCSTNLPIGAVTASGNDGNVPSNVLDNNLNTRWSSLGVGQFIIADLGSTKNICSVDIAWYKGNQRQNSFTISTSKDGSTFTKALEKKSSGTTLNLENYALPNPSARYIKITVNGNTENDYASITEVNIKMLTTVTTPPSPPSNGGGTGDNSAGGDGVKMIYPTLSGAETWFFNPTNPNDGQFERNGAEISKNSDGSWKLKPGTTRMLVFTKSSGLPSDEVRSSLPTYDYSRLAQTGYFYKPSDWKNMEITIYVKVLSTSGGGDEISLVSRSVRHSTNVQEGCGGSSYHNNIDFTNGKFKFKKEMWHVDYDIKPYSGITIGSTMNKWIGFKGIVYNLPDGSVKLESYIDKDNNNNWQKATELVDKGNWGDGMTHCKAKTGGAAITWGSPMVIFKSNGVTYDFKNLSVRQIAPPT